MRKRLRLCIRLNAVGSLMSRRRGLQVSDDLYAQSNNTSHHKAAARARYTHDSNAALEYQRKACQKGDLMKQPLRSSSRESHGNMNLHPRRHQNGSPKCRSRQKQDIKFSGSAHRANTGNRICPPITPTYHGAGSFRMLRKFFCLLFRRHLRQHRFRHSACTQVLTVRRARRVEGSHSRHSNPRVPNAHDCADCLPLFLSWCLTFIDHGSHTQWGMNT